MHPLFFLVSFWAIFVSSLKWKGKLFSLIIAFLPFYIMIATRVSWLPDDVNYDAHWTTYHGMSFSNYLLSMGSGGKFEPGFWLLEQIPSFNATTVIISSIYIITLIYVIYTFVPKAYYPLIIALVFFNPQLATSISARRTTVAMCFFMIAVVMKCKEKRLFSVILAISAVFFHNTAVLMLPFIFIPLNFAKKHLTLVVLGTFSLIALTLFFPGFFNELFIENAEDTALEHYAHYAEGGGSISLFGYIQKLFIVIIVTLVMINFSNNPPNGSYSFLFIMTLLYLSLSVLNIGQARINVYSSLFAFIFVILSYQQKRREESQVLMALFLTFMAIDYLLWYRRLGDYGDSFSQYSSFLF